MQSLPIAITPRARQARPQMTFRGAYRRGRSGPFRVHAPPAWPIFTCNSWVSSMPYEVMLVVYIPLSVCPASDLVLHIQGCPSIRPLIENRLCVPTKWPGAAYED
jgi:hypothetical protein